MPKRKMSLMAASLCVVGLYAVSAHAQVNMPNRITLPPAQQDALPAPAMISGAKHVSTQSQQKPSASSFGGFAPIESIKPIDSFKPFEPFKPGFEALPEFETFEEGSANKD